MLRRLLVVLGALLAVLLGSWSPAAASCTTASGTATYTYDVSTNACVEVHGLNVAEASPAQVSCSRDGTVLPLIGAGGPSTTSAASLVATNTVDDLLPGLPSGAPKPLGLGSTGRVTPGNLTEQLAMTEVRSAPAGVQLTRVTMTDARWPAADGWVKMSQNVNGVEIHYVRNTFTGAVDDFKFAGAG